jgi:hypothetical protein
MIGSVWTARQAGNILAPKTTNAKIDRRNERERVTSSLEYAHLHATSRFLNYRPQLP